MALGTSPSTPEVLSTSPEAAYRLGQQVADRLSPRDSCLPVVVRENPVSYERIAELRQFQIDLGLGKPGQSCVAGGQRVRTLGTLNLS